MKIRIKSILVVCVALTAVLVCVAAISPVVKPLTPYEREQTKGNVRVVLLKVERTTIFNSEGINKPEKGKTYPAPYFGVTFLIEALGEEPVNIWSGSAEMKIGGQYVSDEKLRPDNLISGRYNANFDLMAFGSGAIEMPKVANRKRCVVTQCLDRVARNPSGTLQVTIEAGFNKKTETFVFDGIPVN